MVLPRRPKRVPPSLWIPCRCVTKRQRPISLTSSPGTSISTPCFFSVRVKGFLFTFFPPPSSLLSELLFVNFALKFPPRPTDPPPPWRGAVSGTQHSLAAGRSIVTIIVIHHHIHDRPLFVPTPSLDVFFKSLIASYLSVLYFVLLLYTTNTLAVIRVGSYSRPQFAHVNHTGPFANPSTRF